MIARERQDNRALKKRPVFGSSGHIQCPVCGSELRSFIEVMSMNLKLKLGKQDYHSTVSKKMPTFTPKTVV